MKYIDGPGCYLCLIDPLVRFFPGRQWFVFVDDLQVCSGIDGDVVLLGPVDIVAGSSVRDVGGDDAHDIPGFCMVVLREVFGGERCPFMGIDLWR